MFTLLFTLSASIRCLNLEPPSLPRSAMHTLALVSANKYVLPDFEIGCSLEVEGWAEQ